MEFPEKIDSLSVKAKGKLDHLQTEEATKNALVMPMLAALGYNVFDPTEVVPELTADVGVKRGEKVDYAIKRDGVVVILIECKSVDTALSPDHASQLYRYFSVTDARFAILTNGVDYWFYSDLDDTNRMDSRPFLEFDLFDYTDGDVNELRKFTKETFDVESIVSTANDLKYTREIKRIMAKELADPSEDLVRFFAKQVYDGKLTQAAREQFAGFTRRAFKEFISDKVNDRLKSALVGEHETETREGITVEQPSPEEDGDTMSAVITTVDEVEGFHIVKAIVRQVVDPRRVFMRDTKSYCGVLLDDNNRKPICRLHFNTTNKKIGVFDEDKNETEIPITDLDDIYELVDILKKTASGYDE